MGSSDDSDSAGAGRAPGAPDRGLAAFAALTAPAGRALLDSLPPYAEQDTLVAAEALRRRGVDPDLAAAALTQARLRSRAVSRLGDRAARTWWTPDGLEQVTRPVVAAAHARRFAGAVSGGAWSPAGDGRVADLCCGVGGDLVALAAAGVSVLGVDRDPLTVEAARANVIDLGLSDRVELRLDDVTTTSLDGVGAVFVDPARRSGGRRALDPGFWSPPLSFVLALADRLPVGAKLAPGVPHALLPTDAEAEWVSDGGDLVECGLWTGPLGTGVARRATLLPRGDSLTGDGTRRGEVGDVGAFLLEPDGAVIRAGLVAELGDLLAGRLLDPTIAYLTCDDLPSTPFGTAYAVLDVLPFGLKRLRTYLRAREVGRLTIKKRGTAVRPETLRPQLRLMGAAEATVVLTRVAGEQMVLVVDPI